MNQDYQAITAAYNAQKQFKDAARGAINMACVLCHKNKVTRAFLPCEHASVCDACAEKNDIGPMRPLTLGGKALGRGKVTSGHLVWDLCPICLSNILAVVPCGTTQDPAIKGRVEAMMISVAGGSGAAEAVPARFRSLFARSARVLSDWALKGDRSAGPPTKSALLASGWDGGLEPSDDEELTTEAATATVADAVRSPPVVSPSAKAGWRKH
jgi:hypothetical protein